VRPSWRDRASWIVFMPAGRPLRGAAVSEGLPLGLWWTRLGRRYHDVSDSPDRLTSGALKGHWLEGTLSRAVRPRQ
jgi:hypothetical protein